MAAFRAIQGLGAGGLTVTATALIGDVIPLRERGRYQGMLGAVLSNARFAPSKAMFAVLRSRICSLSLSI